MVSPRCRATSFLGVLGGHGLLLGVVRSEGDVPKSRGGAGAMPRKGSGQSGQVQSVKAVAAGLDHAGERVADRPQVPDLRVDLVDLRDGAVLQRARGMAASAGVEEFRDLVEGEPEPLRRFDHTQQVTASAG